MKDKDLQLLKELEREMWAQFELYDNLYNNDNTPSSNHVYSRMRRHYLEYDVVLTILIDKLERGLLK